MNNLKGFAFGILTSATFGLIPLFTLPLMAKGMQFDSILFYRFLFAALALTGIMAAKNESFHVEKRDIPVLVLLGFFYTASAMFLFWGYNFMSAGIATTLHFTYPIFVTLIMLLVFREKTSWITLMAIILAICGVARLSIGEGTDSSDLPSLTDHPSALGIFMSCIFCDLIKLVYIIIMHMRVNDFHKMHLLSYNSIITPLTIADAVLLFTKKQPLFIKGC